MKKNSISCTFFIENDEYLNYLSSLLSKFNSIDIVATIRHPLEAVELLNHHKTTVLFIETRFADLLNSFQKPPFIVGICNKTNVKSIRNLLAFGFFDLIFTPITEKQCLNVMGKIWNIYSEYQIPKREHLPVASEKFYTDEYARLSKLNSSKDFLFLKKNDESNRINLDDVAFLFRNKHEICFHFDNGTERHTLSTLKYYQQRLPCEKFQKINRETIVNIDKVTKILKPNKIVVANHLFSISRSFKKELKEKMML
jgi:hypothetical protein